MKRKTIICLLGTFPLFVASPAHADVVWPALYLISRMVTWWSIVLGLVVEYLFVRQLTHFDIKKSILVDLAMNAVSCLAGVILIPLAGVGWESRSLNLSFLPDRFAACATHRWLQKG